MSNALLNRFNDQD
ncbi:hypothetical protein VTL71DRAFT_6832 [Oculimacula yallundae]|uniref:Uncharacterized protein n=1 Tax=Oculimacula yallundae TaxID=86028 RepID=A0ABR4BZL5_9HELO